MVHFSFMPRGRMGAALEGQKLVDRRHGGCVPRVNPDLSAPRSIKLLIGNGAAASRHDGSARHGFSVHLEGLGEISGLEGGGDVAHVLADPRDACRVRACVAIEDDPPTIREVFKDVGQVY